MRRAVILELLRSTRSFAWRVINFENMRPGHVFRLFESDGSMVDGGEVSVCLSKPKAVEPPGNWSIESIPANVYA